MPGALWGQVSRAGSWWGQAVGGTWLPSSSRRRPWAAHAFPFMVLATRVRLSAAASSSLLARSREACWSGIVRNVSRWPLHERDNALQRGPCIRETASRRTCEQNTSPRGGNQSLSSWPLHHRHHRLHQTSDSQACITNIRRFQPVCRAVGNVAAPAVIVKQSELHRRPPCLSGHGRKHEIHGGYVPRVCRTA